MILKILLATVLVPAMLSFALMLLLWRVRQPERSRRSLWIGSLILTLAFLTGWILIKGLPRWPVPDAAGWLPFLAMGGFAIGLLCANQKLPLPTTSILRLLVSAATVWLSTQSLQKYTWQDQSWLWVLGLSLLLFIVWNIWEGIASKRDGPIVPLLLTVNFSCLALAALIAESAVISQYAGIVSAALGAMFVASLIRRDLDLSQATLFVIMPLFGSLLINAYFYASLSPVFTGLLLACSLAAIPALSLTRNMKQLPQLLIAAMITAGPFLLAGGMHFVQQKPGSVSSGGDYDYEDYEY